MFKYTIRRTLIAVPTLLGITVVTFLMINLAPGDPAQLQTQGVMDPKMSIRVYEQLREYYGLDQPIHVRYFQWLGRLARLDFGDSMSTDRRPVLDKIKERLWPTMSLALLSMVVGCALAIPDRDLLGRPAEPAVRHRLEHVLVRALLGAQLRHGRAADPVRRRAVGPAAVPGHDLRRLRDAEHRRQDRRPGQALRADHLLFQLRGLGL